MLSTLNVTQEVLRTGLGETARFATSLREALGRVVDRNGFAASFLTRMGERSGMHRQSWRGGATSTW